MKNIKLIFALFLFTQVNYAQERNVTGAVVDKYGDPIPGVNVAINKTPNGTQTDFDGKYSLKVSLKDTLVFSYLGMKTQKIKVDKEKINVQLEEDELIIEGGIPYMPPRITRKELSTITVKELKIFQKKLSNPKYSFKKNAKNNVFIIFVSNLTSYDLNEEDKEFQQKYNVSYSLIGSYEIDYLTKYNKLTFKHLNKKFKKSWLNLIRKDAIGLKKE